MEVSRYWRDKLKHVNPGLFVEWHAEFGRNQIKHKDDRTGLIRNVMFIQTPEGDPCDMNDNLINYLITKVEWTRIEKYPDPNELWESIEKDMRTQKSKRELEKIGFLTDFNRDHRKEWKAIMAKEMRNKHIADYLKREAEKKWKNRRISNI